MFIGRIDEIRAVEQAFIQTRAGQPKHFMVTGERGIGKTSLLNYMRWVAQGDITSLHDEKFNFLVLDLDIEKGTTPIALSRKIERALQYELGKTEPARDFLFKTWDFVRRIEAGGVSLPDGEKSQDAENLLDELAYSLSGTLERVCDTGSDGSVFSARYEGVLLCIDEADSASKQLQFGSLWRYGRTESPSPTRTMDGAWSLTRLRRGGPASSCKPT
jgi:Cdc6-like AAA superfamily ATPase